MSGLLKRLGRLLTINPEWTDSMAPSKIFRVPSPGSDLSYTPPPNTPESFTSGYAYFKRDSRRSYPQDLVIRPQLTALPSSSSLATYLEMPFPGVKRVYRRSETQPPAQSYFPIVNCE